MKRKGRFTTEADARREREQRLVSIARHVTPADVDEWPLGDREQIVLRVEYDRKLGPEMRGGPVSIDVDGKTYALNGLAITRGYPSATPLFGEHSTAAVARLVELACSWIPPEA
jgi:hypothetical protein